MFAVNSLITRTDITCVKFSNNNVLAGLGGKLCIFDENLLSTKTIDVFKGQQIFGINPNGSQTEFLIYGENQLKILSGANNYEQIASFTFDDWMLAAKWINLDTNIATASMHNNISLWTKDLQLLQTVVCAERCILYSAHLVNDVWEDLIVLSGTVFSEILLWRPVKQQTQSPVLARLEGHKGVIFSIDYNRSTGIICSTSDDRSARLWSAKCNDLTKELELEDPEIILQCTLFCHTARVFRCLVLESCVITAGEDSLLIVWNFSGQIMRKVEVHQGASVWSLDYNCTNAVVATGGGDCGITLFSLEQNIVQHELAVANKEVLKKLAILNDGSIVCISENGSLLLYQGEHECGTELHTHEDLANYSLLEVSQCRNLLALAGYHGSIHIYKLDNSLARLCSWIDSDKSRVFALHWLSSSKFVTCATEGLLQTWSIENSALIPQYQYILPSSKERWTTCACICSNALIAVGDRRGNIYVYEQGSLEPRQIIKKAHNYLGVTNLYFKENVLVSLGRNSVVKTYQFDESGFSNSSLDKLPFTWLTSIHEEDNCKFLLAFLGGEFVVWDYKKRRTLLHLQCGGGHRSWDFHKFKDTIKFAFIKDKCINLVQLNSKVLDTKDLLDGFHVNEINSVICFSTTHNTLLISGGEDTTLRVSTIDCSVKPKFSTKSVLKSHLSSIRTIAGCKINSGLDFEEFLVFSAGGRAQIILWQLKVFLDGKHAICEKFSHYEQLTSEESETRIMDLCIIVVNAHVILIAGTSGGTLKIFLVTNDKGEHRMELLGEVVYKLKCILKVKYLTMCRESLVLSTATDGNVVFWNFTKLVNALKELPTGDFKGIVKEIGIVESVNVHASGINSFDCKIVKDDLCVFVTGGDDNAIKVSLISFSLSNAELSIEVSSSFTDTETHCAQVTGTFLDDNYLVTASIDQKLSVCNWNVENDVFVSKTKQIIHTDISDIQGMKVWKHGNSLFVIVFGKGIELFQIDDDICNKVFNKPFQ